MTDVEYLKTFWLESLLDLNAWFKCLTWMLALNSFSSNHFPCQSFAWTRLFTSLDIFDFVKTHLTSRMFVWPQDCLFNLLNVLLTFWTFIQLLERPSDFLDYLNYSLTFGIYAWLLRYSFDLLSTRLTSWIPVLLTRLIHPFFLKTRLNRFTWTTIWLKLLGYTTWSINMMNILWHEILLDFMLDLKTC